MTSTFVSPWRCSLQAACCRPVGLSAAGSAKGRGGCPVAQAAPAPSTGGDAQKSPHAAILEAIYLEWVVFFFSSAFSLSHSGIPQSQLVLF